jgi:hypothetical protein
LFSVLFQRRAVTSLLPPGFFALPGPRGKTGGCGGGSAPPARS